MGGGGGGARPPNVPTGEKNVHVTYMRERAPHVSKYICIHIQSMQFPFITCGMAIDINNSIAYRQNTNIETCASELRKFSYFHILKLLFPSIFCWYFRYFVSGLKLHLHTYTINAVSFYYLWYALYINDSIPTKQ